MKNVLLIAVFLISSVCLIAQNELLETKTFFSSGKDAEVAFLSGHFRYYQPDPKNIKAVPPKLAKGLPSAYIVLEEVRENPYGSPSWVILAEGTPVVFSSGIPIMDGRCWNKILKAYPLEKYIPLSMLGKLKIPGPAGKDGRDGIDGRDGRDGIDLTENSWNAGKTALTILGTGLGAVGAGYAFPKESYKVKVITTPGIEVQSGDGTIIFGPDITTVTKHKQSRFNPTAAIVGGLASGIITALLCEYVF